eukprot:TRINITY_DN3460_c0_g1_i1.p1 TRINITY_DN3460_c0_g1~~TRINITY_DN3460_c0_g1_i1.p1  ORF type:complete len:431 (-),score=79.11 TRINITY_DN3460_c0_g1_i1:157-1449(-)
MSSAKKIQVEDEFDGDDLLKNYSGRGTVFSSYFNLLNTIVGAGILALPFAFKGCGIILGIFLLIIYAIAAAYGGHLLVLCRLPPIKSGRSIDEFGASVFGRRLGPIITRVSIFARFIGALVAYVAVIGEVISPYISLVVNMDERLITFIVCTFTMYPLINLRKIDSLSFTSSIAVFLIVFNMSAVIIKSIVITKSTTWDSDGVQLFKFGYQMIGALPIISFAYTFTPNIHPIFEELKVPSKKNILKAIYSAVASCCFLYILVASTGYMAFQDEVSDNILINFRKDTLMDMVKIAYCFVICFSYPVVCFPVRKMIDQVFFKTDETRLRTTVEALAIYIVSFVLGISVPGISVVFGLTGGTAGSMIVFILPAIFYLHLKRSDQEFSGDYPWYVYRYFSPEKWPALLLLLLGLFTMFFGTYSVIVDMVRGVDI